ncbi:MAG: peptidylprolyl isomerase [Silicimonas sp.]|nr:peptidylprolyl isomerase [Silicimonas sp.]
MYRGLIAAVMILLVSLTGAQAQGRFSPELQVGESVVTRYQIDQRTRFLTLLGAPGDVRTLAREQLINEAVQFAAARAAGIELSEEEVAAGTEEFAARANLTAEQFVAALGQNGVEAQTFRDFVSAGVVWRTYVRSEFGEEARSTVSQAQTTRALAQTGTQGGTRVLISEILLPKTNPETALASRARAAELSALKTEAAFSAAAREFSVSTTASRGGEVAWVDLETLPEVIRPVISRLTPGQISRPVELETSIGVFLLRDVELVAAGTPETLLIDYAVYNAISAQDAASVQARIDVCDDLYGIAKGLPESRLIRETQPSTQLPADLRAEVARLDAGESSLIERSGRSALLMLCARRPSQESTVDLEIVGNRLLNARLGSTALNELANLRANTIVIDLTQ